MKVMSTDRRKFYEVTSSSCTCPDYVYRQAKQGGACKHMVKLFRPSSNIQIDNIQLSDTKEWFRDGANIEESCEKFGDKKIKEWIDTGEICEHILNGKKVYRLD